MLCGRIGEWGVIWGGIGIDGEGGYDGGELIAMHKGDEILSSDESEPL